jgi:uncharacterized membrane protein
MALYRNPRDKRIFVPRPNGSVVLTLGHPIAWAILMCMTVIPFVIVTVVTIAVFL